MADDAPNPDETPVTFNVKSSSDARYVITLPLTTTVADLKTKLAGSDYADIPADRQRLIYSGRVLKDADALSIYKIKEGNTVHLVKGAASNQRQNPANSAQVPSAGSSQGAAGVPSNLAAGTGRDPLAALTGARYAGFAQMPNANMFGPDGGMGPPPDPEQMASMLDNPAFASQLNEALSNPDVIEQMIRSNPMFQGPMAEQARQMMNDPNFRRMMTDPETIRNMSNLRRQMPGLMGGGLGQPGQGNSAFPMPGNAEGAGANTNDSQTPTDQPPSQQQQQPPPLQPNPFQGFGNAGAGNPFAALFGGMNPPAGTAGAQREGGQGNANTPSPSEPQQQGGSGAPQNPFVAAQQALLQNPQLMQQLLGAMGGGGGSEGHDPNGGNRTGSNPFTGLPGGFGAFNPAMFGALGGGGSPSPQPRDDRPPEERYAEQLRQLNDMGFYEFERNIEALRRTGGSVQGAVEYLLTR